MKGRFLLRHFFLFVVVLFSIIVMSILLFIALNFNLVKKANDSIYPAEIYNEIIENDTITENAKTIMDDNNIWLIIINENGELINSYKKPNDVENHYEITDIAKFIRWYLKDYPVFTYVYNKNLIVLGYPKNSYVKLASNYFKINPTLSVIKNILLIILIDILLLFLIYIYSKRKILREITPVRNAIKNLSKGEIINETECDNLSEILDELIMASDIIEDKNISKNKWLRGITHDIRTPLTVITSYSEELSDSINDEILKSKVDTIKTKSILINRILESLNTIYILEDKTSLKNEKINLNNLIKNIAIDYINTYNIHINIHLSEETIFLSAREVLIERLIRNIIDNSIKHNSSIIIDIILDEVALIISDNGKITENEVLKLNLITDEYNTKENGYGILIVKKIASLYKYDIKFEYSNGLRTIMKLKQI